MNNIDNVIKDLEIFGFNVKKVSKLDGGINSSAFKIVTNSEKYVLKIYNSNKTNNINRFHKEEIFLEFLSKCNFKNVPRIIKSSPKKDWILITWIEGEKINKVNLHLCRELLDFLIRLQDFRKSSFSKELTLASDTYLNLNGYITAIEDRLILLLKRQQELININKELSIKLKDIIEKIKSEISNLVIYSKKNKIDLNYVLPEENRIISQSDVGFHNIIYKDSKANFIDFEYSGWDDPNKLFCDLLLQPDHNIPMKYIDVLEFFVQNYIFKINYHSERLTFMLKLSRIKWALIILNPIINKKALSNNELLDLLRNKIKKSNKYLEKTVVRINHINESFLRKSFNNKFIT